MDNTNQNKPGDLPENADKSRQPEIDDIRKDNEFEEEDIINYLYYVCGYLRETENMEIDRDEVSVALKLTADMLENIRTFYEFPAPAGGEAAREVMLEILSHIKSGIDDIFFYMNENETERLSTGVRAIEEAEALIDSLRNTIAQQRLDLAEILSKIKSGQIKEGEPIEEIEKEPLEIAVKEMKLPETPTFTFRQSARSQYWNKIMQNAQLNLEAMREEKLELDSTNDNADNANETG